MNTSLNRQRFWEPYSKFKFTDDMYSAHQKSGDGVTDTVQFYVVIKYTVQLAFISPRFLLKSTRWQRRFNGLKTLCLNALKPLECVFFSFILSAHVLKALECVSCRLNALNGESANQNHSGGIPGDFYFSDTSGSDNDNGYYCWRKVMIVNKYFYIWI